MHEGKPLASRLVLGTAQWGMAYGVTNNLDVPSAQEVRSMLGEAEMAGCRWVDSAFSYGDALEKISHSNVTGAQSHLEISCARLSRRRLTSKLRIQNYGKTRPPSRCFQCFSDVS